VLLLRCHYFGDGGALQLLELCRRQSTSVGLRLRIGESVGANEGADMVGMEGELCATHVLIFLICCWFQLEELFVADCGDVLPVDVLSAVVYRTCWQ
jgi:hypothetical protein